MGHLNYNIAYICFIFVATIFPISVDITDLNDLCFLLVQVGSSQHVSIDWH